jgi:hypothetical protein
MLARPGEAKERRAMIAEQMGRSLLASSRRPLGGNKDPPRPNRPYCARLKTRLMVVTGTDQVLGCGLA